MISWYHIISIISPTKKLSSYTHNKIAETHQTSPLPPRLLQATQATQAVASQLLAATIAHLTPPIAYEEGIDRSITRREKREKKREKREPEQRILNNIRENDKKSNGLLLLFIMYFVCKVCLWSYLRVWVVVVGG